MSSEQMLAHADVIVSGVVVGAEGRWSGQGQSMIATDYRIQLNRVVHDPDGQVSAICTGDTLTLSMAGGEVNGRKVAVPGIPHYDLGETVILFIDSDELGSISPLVGVFAGDYRVSRAPETAGRVVGPSGAVIMRSFFATDDDVVDGFTLTAFLAEIERALPIALSDPSLKLYPSENPTASGPAVHTGSQIPQAIPSEGGVVSPSGPTTVPSQDTTEPPKNDER